MKDSGIFAVVSLFSGIGTEAMADLSSQISVEMIPRGAVVFEAGDTTTDVFLVLSGEVFGMLVSADGKEVAVSTIPEGACFGEFAALDGLPRSLTIQTLRETRLGRIPAPVFLGWIEKYPVIARNLLTSLVQRTRVMNQRLFEVIVHDVETRVRLMIVRLALEAGQLVDGGEVPDAPSHNMIASHVGANREAVSRVLSGLTKSGVLTSGRKKIRIEKVEALLRGL